MAPSNFCRGPIDVLVSIYTVKPIIIALLLISLISRQLMITRILLALIYVQNSITMPHLVVIQLMRVIKWPRSHSHGSCVNKKGRGFKGFYSTIP